MKIAESIRLSYREQRALAERLQVEVDKEIVNRKQRTWHYESRIKAEESFALKVEAGFAPRPAELEDLFAGVLVVPNYSEIPTAVELLTNLYRLKERRPPSSALTSKAASDFRFDDVRLYLTYPQNEYGPPSIIDGRVFEIQVRTFLQHAWTVATHDLIFKARDVSWRRERVAHQAKASLEQAEVTIEAMASLEASPVLPETDAKSARINEIINALDEHWPADRLPQDTRRLASGLSDLLGRLRLGAELDIKDLLQTGRAAAGGDHKLDWSPYRSVMFYVAQQHGGKLRRYVRDKNAKGNVFLYPEVFETLGISPDEALRATHL